MLIYSMTAFARSQHKAEEGSFVCEMRSINHRYLDISVYLPDILRAFEMPIRDKIREFVKRGKIECGIRFQPPLKNSNGTFSVNQALASELIDVAQQMSATIKHPAPLNLTEILRFPGVLETKDTDVATLENRLFKILETTLKELVMARGREGEELKRLFNERLDAMQVELKKVRVRFPSVIQEAQNRLTKRFAEARVELDPTRLEQEMVMYAQKIDVSEETDRLEMHINEVRRILKEGGIVGRRLDFLMQELNREANTLGSKSTDSVLTHAAVELKVLIEQLREQVQNVE